MPSPTLEITDIHPDEFDRLLDLWEASVRATHDFLDDSDIDALKSMFRQEALPYLYLRGVRNAHGDIQGFIGIDGHKVESLFVDPAAFGRGIGRMLMDFAETVCGTKRVDVNEQNPRAIGFYRHLGYRVIDRSPVDAQGNPFPILHLQKN